MIVILHIINIHYKTLNLKGYVSIKDMITTGLIMNIFGLLTVYLAANTWLKLIFDLTPLTFTIASNTTIMNNSTY